MCSYKSNETANLCWTMNFLSLASKSIGLFPVKKNSQVCSFVCCSKLLVEMICNNLLCGVFCSYLKF